MHLLKRLVVGLNLDRALAKEKTKDIFNQAVTIIIEKLGLANIALSIFSERSIVYVYDEPPTMSLCIVGGGKYLWKINATNCSTMHPNEIAWVILHECLHYILKHIQMWPLFRNKKAANIAADMIVNDLAFEVIKDVVGEDFFKPFKYNFYSGINTIGVITCNMTLEEAYKRVMLLPQPPEELPAQLGNHDPHNSDAPCLDKASDDLGRMFTDTPDGGSSDGKKEGAHNNPTLTQEQVQRVGAGSDVERRGNQVVGVARAIFNFSKIFVKLTGKKLLRGSDDDIGNTWLKKPRAMISLDPLKGTLPGIRTEPQKRYFLDLFIDVSGSVTAEQCAFFANFVNFIPRKKWEVRIHSFNTSVHSDIAVDPNGKIVNLKTGGGTSFDAVARFVLTETPTPDNIIVVTDGEDELNQTLIKNPNQWAWVVDNSSRFEEIKTSLVGRVYSLKSISKELSL